MHPTRIGACLASLSLAAVISAAATETVPLQSTLADQPQDAAQKKDSTPKPATEQNKQLVAKKLEPVGTEVGLLRSRAKAVTDAIGAMAAQGQIPTNDQSVDQLKKLVEELAKINEQLKKLQEDVEGINGWIEGQNESQPVLLQDVENLKKATWGNYMQFQFNDAQNNPSIPRPNDGFNLRRVRLSTTNKIDPRTSMKISFDMAAGNRRVTADLKDAFMTYDIEPSFEKTGIQLIAGQQPIPLGYELERSSSSREFPERAQYNQRLMAGERGRGVQLKYGLGENAYVHAGVWNSLTVNDPQQTELDTFRNLSGTRMAGSAGVRYHTRNLDLGLSGFVGYRNDITFTPTGGTPITTEGGQRQFIYLDGTYVDFLVPNLTLRGEMMFGKDRVPQFSGSGVTRTTASSFGNVRGHQLQLTYKLDQRNSLSARYEFFDPNTKNDDNIFGWGLAYSHLINSGLKLTLAHEIFREQGVDIRNNVTTLRLQFKLK